MVGSRFLPHSCVLNCTMDLRSHHLITWSHGSPLHPREFLVIVFAYTYMAITLWGHHSILSFRNFLKGKFRDLLIMKIALEKIV